MKADLRMKVALINACDEHDLKQRYFPALGLGYLAAFAQKHAPGRYEYAIARTADEVVATQPDVVGISSTTQSFELSKLMAARFKRSLGTPVILGGVHITALPETLPRDVDIAVLGEGEETFLHLVELYRSRGQYTSEALRGLSSIAYRQDGRIVANPRHRANHEIDCLPFPDRTLMRNVVFQEGAHIIASRGCPYNCSFCYNRSFWLGVSSHSPDYFVREVRHVVDEYGPRWIYIYDDLFAVQEPRLSEIVNLLRRSGVTEHTAFRIYLRADGLTDDVCALLKNMNVRSIDVGFESNSARILGMMDKKRGPESNQRCVDLCQRFGIGVYGTFIIGYPGEQPKDIDATIDFIRCNKLRLRSALTIPLYAYPGTRVWEYARRRRLVSPDMNFNSVQTSQVESFNMDSYILLNPEMSRHHFKAYFDICMELYNEILYEPSQAKETTVGSGQ